jgi:hypothetical protein
MQRRLLRALLAFAIAFGALAAPAAAEHDGNADVFGLTKLFDSPNTTGAINSDLAFWGNRAYPGNYDGFRIFDISNPARPPVQLVDFKCHGPQNDTVVWQNKLLFTAIDRTQTGPECGSVDTTHPDGTPFHDDPSGWEGVRIFDVSDPTAPEQVGSVYTDCGAHTITLYPKNPAQILLYVSSYPLRPGPTCGPIRGPEAGNSPLHEKISVIRVPVNNPEAAKVIAEPRISYPGDLDNKFDPDEHGLHGFDDLTGCHDIGVFVELRLAAAACAEQTQLWRIRPNGIPATQRPLWVFDDNVDTNGAGNRSDVAVDFWHTARFTWDGKYVQADDESFGTGCPTVTAEYRSGPDDPTAEPADTGSPHLLNAKTGQRTSHFTPTRPAEVGYCSMHQGNYVRTADGYFSVNAWYEWGVNVIDWSDPFNPEEVAFYDVDSDNWAAYWYEGPSLPEPSLTIYGTDGVEDPPTGEGFQVFHAGTDLTEDTLGRLNPQTQETLIEGDDDNGDDDDRGRGSAGSRKRAGASARARGGRTAASSRGASHLAP